MGLLLFVASYAPKAIGEDDAREQFISKTVSVQDRIGWQSC